LWIFPKDRDPIRDAKGETVMAFDVKIIRVTQGPDGFEKPANPLQIDSQDFLWIYVEAVLPSGAAPRGEYFREVGGKPDPASRVPLGPPTPSGGMYRFSVIHYVLSPQTTYWFHFADNLASPSYEDHWEIVTIAASQAPKEGTEGDAEETEETNFAVAALDVPHTVWGVDSARTANGLAADGATLAFDAVTAQAGATPAFWGRYIVGNFVITSTEAAYLQGKGCKILLISNGPTNTAGSVQGGFAEGQSDGNAAADFASNLGVPAGVALYADIEGSWSPTSDWLRGWATAVNAKNYVSGFYANCTPGSAFDQAYCTAKGAEPAVAGSLLWSMQPEPNPQCQAAAAAPTYAPAATSCNGLVVLWQYTEDCWEGLLGANAGIDMDLAMDAAIAVMW
jgi:hypothetical protein